MVEFQSSTIALMLTARKTAAMPVMCILQPSLRSPSARFLREWDVGFKLPSSHLESKFHQIFSLHEIILSTSGQTLSWCGSQPQGQLYFQSFEAWLLLVALSSKFLHFKNTVHFLV
jgi:hypothetical protein